MKRIFFALFKDAACANTALMRAREAGLLESASVNVHEGPLREEDLSLAATDGREGFVGGLIVGAMAGACAVFVAAMVLGLGATDVMVPAVALGMLAGAAFGGLLAGVVGASVPDRVLESWNEELGRGRAALTVVAESREQERELEAVFRECGAVEARKPAF